MKASLTEGMQFAMKSLKTWLAIAAFAGAIALAADAEIRPIAGGSTPPAQRLAKLPASSSDDKEAWIPAAQYFGTKGFFASYDAKLDAPLTEAVRSVWLDGFKQLQQGTLDAAKLALAVHAAESLDSPATGELRADALLRLWKQLNGQP